jgi:hypothetical protein
MSGTSRLVRGHIVLVVTPHPGGGPPTYRGYVVAEEDPARAKALVEERIGPGETAYVLGMIPGAALLAFPLEPGWTMRL